MSAVPSGKSDTPYLGISPIRVDDHCLNSGLSLAEVRNCLPEDILEHRPGMAWWSLFRAMFLLALGPLLLSQLHFTEGWALAWQIPAHIGLWLLYGFALVGLFTIGHDAGHEAFSKTPWVNTLVGHLCMFPLVNSFAVWVITHDHHHANTQLRGHEVDWAAQLKTREELAQISWRKDPIIRLGYTLPFGVFFWILWNTFRRSASVNVFLPERQFAKEKRRLFLSNAFMLLGAVGIYGGLFWAGGFWFLLKYYGIAAFVATWVGALVVTLQHANAQTLYFDQASWKPIRGQMVSTFDIRFSRPLSWMWCHIDIHIPHHIAPRIPWYKLPEARAALKAAYPELYQERPFRLKDLSWMLRTPYLERDEARGVWGLSSP
jgi:omega-6 fatty acid desaturase (delta-12 desaturase)